jgi:hypothetical protein
LGKVQHHTRLQGRRRLDARTVVDHEKLTYLVEQGQDTAVVKAQRSEVLDAITTSLNTLKLQYRNILTLRCFEQLSYAEIAAVTGSTELQARLLFFRAKRALQRKLSHRGIKRDTLLSALTLFGTLTALRTQGASAGTIVTSEALKTGALAGAIGIITTNTVLTGTAVLALGLAVAPLGRNPARTNKATPSNYLVTVPDSVNTDRVFPPWIIEAHDPDNSGWFGLFTQRGNAFARRAPLDPEMLIRRRWEGCCLLLPEGHWMTFGLPRMIVDAGDGSIDICCFCLNTGPDPSIFLTDGKTQEIQLHNVQVYPLNEQKHRLDIDLEGLQVPFRPTAVRIEGHGPASGDHTALYRLEVRIAPPDSEKLNIKN